MRLVVSWLRIRGPKTTSDVLIGLRFNVDCTEAEANYGVNENLGVIPPPNEDYDDDDDGFSRDRGRRRQRLFSEEEEQPRSGIRQQQINAQETEYEDEYDYGDDDIFVEYDDDNDYGDEDLDAFIRENLEEEEYTEEEEPVHDVIKQLEDAVREVEQEEQVRSDVDDDDDEVRQRPQQKSNNGRRAQFNNINGRRRKNKNKNNRRRPTTTITTTSTTTPASSSSSSQGIHAGTAASAISGGNSLDGGILDPPVTTLRPRLATLQLEPNQSFQESRQEPPPGFEEVLRANVDHQEEDTSTTTEFKRPRQERKQNERRRRKKKNKRRRKQQQQQQQNQQQFRVRDPLSSPDQIVDIVHYDATLPDGISDDYNDGVPLLFADPFVEVREPDSPNRLYDAPPLGRKR